MQIYKNFAKVLDMIAAFGLVGISTLMIWLVVIAFKQHKFPFPFSKYIVSIVTTAMKIN